MKIYMLTKYKIQSLSLGPRELILDDILALVRDIKTKIVNSNQEADQLLHQSKELKYKYKITVDEV